METIIGIVGKDCVLFAADAMAGRSIMVFKDDEDKILPLHNNRVIGMVGPQADRARFGDYIKRNIYLEELRNEVEFPTSALANFTRSQLHDALRSGPYQVNVLLGGVDTAGPELYYMDYLASMQPVNFGVHGHAANFLLSVFDKYWVPDMNKEELMELFRRCVHELSTRFLISLPKWKIKICYANKIEELDFE